MRAGRGPMGAPLMAARSPTLTLRLAPQRKGPAALPANSSRGTWPSQQMAATMHLHSAAGGTRARLAALKYAASTVPCWLCMSVCRLTEILAPLCVARSVHVLRGCFVYGCRAARGGDTRCTSCVGLVVFTPFIYGCLPSKSFLFNVNTYAFTPT